MATSSTDALLAEAEAALWLPEWDDALRTLMALGAQENRSWTRDDARAALASCHGDSRAAMHRLKAAETLKQSASEPTIGSRAARGLAAARALDQKVGAGISSGVATAAATAEAAAATTQVADAPRLRVDTQAEARARGDLALAAAATTPEAKATPQDLILVFDGVEDDANEIRALAGAGSATKRALLIAHLASVRRRLEARFAADADARPEDATRALAALAPLLDATLALLHSGRGFAQAVATLDSAFGCLVVVAEHQTYALREDAEWDQHKAALLDAVARARAAARRSPSLRADGAPAFVLELALAEIELGLRALHDPNQGAKAAGALAKIGIGVLRSVAERKVDVGVFEGIADLGSLGIEQLRRKNAERLAFQARLSRCL